MALITPGGGGGGSGSSVLLFDQTLGADTATIDTGANGIAQTQNTLEVIGFLRTDDAAVFAFHNMNINNDATSQYDLYNWTVNAAAGAVASSYLDSKWPLRVKGNTGTAYFSVLRCIFPNYTNTTQLKSAEGTIGVIDASTGNSIWEGFTIGHRTITAGISRLAISGQGAAKFKAGSRLTIYGR